jgi:hypothetical protein
VGEWGSLLPKFSKHLQMHILQIMARLPLLGQKIWMIINGFALFFMFMGCKHPKEYFILPNGEVIPNMTIDSFAKRYELSFRQYAGFKGDYHDSLINDMLIMPTDNGIIGTDVLTSEQIEQLKQENVSYIIFNISMTDTLVATKSRIEKYIFSKYAKYTLVKINSHTYDMIDNNGEKVSELQYFSEVLPHYFLYVYAVH